MCLRLVQDPRIDTRVMDGERVTVVKATHVLALGTTEPVVADALLPRVDNVLVYLAVVLAGLNALRAKGRRLYVDWILLNITSQRE